VLFQDSSSCAPNETLQSPLRQSPRSGPGGASLTAAHRPSRVPSQATEGAARLPASLERCQHRGNDEKFGRGPAGNYYVLRSKPGLIGNREDGWPRMIRSTVLCQLNETPPVSPGKKRCHSPAEGRE